MFCVNCGNKLAEGAKFCTNCGNNTEKVGGTVRQAPDDKEVKLQVKPTFKLIYMGFTRIVATGAFLGLMLIFGFLGAPIVFLLVYIGMFAIIMAIPLISLVFQMFQYKKLEYNFYNTKVVYSDGFLNKMEKEVKYKYIREIVLRQSFIQRLFKLGTIVLYTNAESVSSGISVLNITNSEEIYKKIKEIAKM